MPKYLIQASYTAEGVKWDPLLLGPAVDNSTAPA